VSSEARVSDRLRINKRAGISSSAVFMLDLLPDSIFTN
jgi:hypothetical protein